MRPYTDEEIRSKHETIRRQIAGLTHGLIEMATSSGPLFFSRSIQFFHRTARDFVLENAHLQKLHAESPGLTSPDTYLRLYIAELWFSRPGTLNDYRFPEAWEHHYQEFSDPRLLLPTLAKARAYHNSDSSHLSLTGESFTFRRLGVSVTRHLPRLPESQLHYIIRCFNASEYIKFVALQTRKLLGERDGLSCLLSACIPRWSLFSCLENVRCLLSLGVSPRELVLVRYEDTSDVTREIYVPVWSVFLGWVVECLCLLVRGVSTVNTPQVWDVVELLLKYGGYGNNFFLFTLSENISVPAYVISLQELIRQCKPRNQEALLQLIDKDVPSSFRSRLKKWRNTRQRSSETPFDPAQYKPFHLSMLRPSQDSGKYMYDLYSVWSAGCETKIQGLTVRIS
jgi:hypothetical protein